MTDSKAGDSRSKFEPLTQSSGEVPVFSLVVYVARRDNKTEARAANLEGFSCAAADERAALQKLLAEVKQRVTECIARKEQIEWLDPPLERAPEEQQRVIPFHL